MNQFDKLDEIAMEVAKGKMERTGVLSTGERVYVALAANHAQMLDDMNYTIAEAIARLGPEWTQELIDRWQHQGNPKNFG